MRSKLLMVGLAVAVLVTLGLRIQARQEQQRSRAEMEELRATLAELKTELGKAPAVTYEESQRRVLKAFAGEAVDGSWSEQAGRELEAIARGHLPDGSRLDSIECRATMCRVEVAHRHSDSHLSFLMDGFRGWRGSIFVAGEKQERGERVVTYIAARRGTEPPIAPR
jgi:hypothetical protein